MLDDLSSDALPAVDHHSLECGCGRCEGILSVRFPGRIETIHEVLTSCDDRESNTKIQKKYIKPSEIPDTEMWLSRAKLRRAKGKKQNRPRATPPATIGVAIDVPCCAKMDLCASHSC